MLWRCGTQVELLSWILATRQWLTTHACSTSSAWVGSHAHGHSPRPGNSNVHTERPSEISPILHEWLTYVMAVLSEIEYAATPLSRHKAKIAAADSLTVQAILFKLSMDQASSLR